MSLLCVRARARVCVCFYSMTVGNDHAVTVTGSPSSVIAPVDSHPGASHGWGGPLCQQRTAGSNTCPALSSPL